MQLYNTKSLCLRVVWENLIKYTQSKEIKYQIDVGFELENLNVWILCMLIA